VHEQIKRKRSEMIYQSGNTAEISNSFVLMTFGRNQWYKKSLVSPP